MNKSKNIISKMEPSNLETLNQLNIEYDEGYESAYEISYKK
jgi:hypothetical protein